MSELKGAEASYPFGPDALVFKIAGKMFALVSQTKNTAQITLKCKPADAEILVGQYDEIIPGYHMNKRHWITIRLDGKLSPQLLNELMGNSYTLVANKLTRANRASIL